MRGELTVQEELLVRGGRLVMPTIMRPEILDRLHSAHQGITKCRLRARESVWWPGLSGQLEKMVQSCPICSQERKNHWNQNCCIAPPDSETSATRKATSTKSASNLGPHSGFHTGILLLGNPNFPYQNSVDIHCEIVTVKHKDLISKQQGFLYSLLIRKYVDET